MTGFIAAVDQPPPEQAILSVTEQRLIGKHITELLDLKAVAAADVGKHITYRVAAGHPEELLLKGFIRMARSSAEAVA